MVGEKALFPAALRVEERACRTERIALRELRQEAEEAKSEPQSSAMWDIKPKYQSDTGWQDAISALNRMLEDEEGRTCPRH